MMKKIVLGATLLCSSFAVSAYDFSSYSEAFSTEDYRTALNMGLKFYGGQRCGDTHNWMLVDNPIVNPKCCHTKDGTGSLNNGGNGNYDLTGGWHDCGDHIKVAVTMGYSAVSLLVAYDLWANAFQDNYDEAYGAPNGIPDVLDEVKIATDYFMKSFPDDNNFVYYVGDGQKDHNVWVTSSAQSSMSVNEGGDPRPFFMASDKGGPQAANYSSALSLMAMCYPDASYRDKCKQYALKAYAFAKKNKSRNAAIPVFYQMDDDSETWKDELSLAAILLYRLTGESQYQQDALDYLKGKWESNYPLAWNTVADFAYYYLVKCDPNANNGEGGFFYDHMVKNVTKHLAAASTDSNGFRYVEGQEWGTNKLACGSAGATSLLLKLMEDGVVSCSLDKKTLYNFITRTVDYMLGKNQFNHPFLHGFKNDMTHRIHHRNAMGVNENIDSNAKNSHSFLFASGGLIGGTNLSGQFSNIIEGGDSYKQTEGGCDYNAPFILTIARIAAEKDPSGFDTRTNTQLSDESFMVYPTSFDDYLVVDKIVYAGDDVHAKLVSLSGKVLLEKKINDMREVILTSDVPAGFYILQIEADGVSANYKLIKK